MISLVVATWTGARSGLVTAPLLAVPTLGPAWWRVLVATVLLGALFDAIAGFRGHWVTGGHRAIGPGHRRW